MNWEDTVMKAGDLCLKVCQDHRTATLECKDCTGLDCEECQLQAQAEITGDIAFKAGIKEVVEGLGLYENELGFCEISNHISLAKLKEWGK